VATLPASDDNDRSVDRVSIRTARKIDACTTGRSNTALLALRAGRDMDLETAP
jgi:hypothetical protein